ncbi:hypothetical protein GGR56DRAFT_608776 [Xylariaceae sp. FL0804]|nr:hypothetical protein GGR56DRAFT_608776 [Xylariaceae sp. FL0804]
MKYGQRLDELSVPAWNLHNIDYNSLKHQIKTHTVRDQAAAAATATAIAIPGRLGPGGRDPALQRFEDGFYDELAAQHDRVGLFVATKADEISRRLQYLSDQVRRLIARCTDDPRGLSVKRRRKLAKYQLQTDECGRDVDALRRFVDAQVTAFRKILKKYRKWTGSTTLGARFGENVLDSPKSFTRHDFSPLQMHCEELQADVERASLIGGSKAGLHHDDIASSPSSSRRASTRSSQTAVAPAEPPWHATTYWNEYEHGSGNDDDDADSYVIYINPDEGDEFPGLAQVRAMFAAPVNRVRHWLGRYQTHRRGQQRRAHSHSAGTARESQPLVNHLHNPSDGNGDGDGDDDTVFSPADYFSINRHAAAAATEADATTEDDNNTGYVSSSSERPYVSSPYNYRYHPDYHHHHTDARLARYRDRVLTRSVALAFAAAFVLLGVSGALVATGRRRMRVEVDAAAAVGAVASLLCACVGLGAMLHRQYPPSLSPSLPSSSSQPPHHHVPGCSCWYAMAVWSAFVAACALDGMLLVLVVGNSGV